ncbi:hypothetical protein OC844_002731 [Tilletia horrida]|nr:hypothetical protein OC844_002731 [Tilletia horrida]
MSHSPGAPAPLRAAPHPPSAYQQQQQQQQQPPRPLPVSGSLPALSPAQQQQQQYPQQQQQQHQYSHAHSHSLGSAPLLNPAHPQQSAAASSSSSQGRHSLRPMSAYQPLEHPAQTPSAASGASASASHHQHQYRDSDQASFRSNSNVVATVRPPAPPIKFKSQDLRDALALHDAHTRKVYMEGYLSRRDELNPQGRPLHPADDRSRWSLCFLQLCGTVLSVWSVAEMTKAAAEGKEVPPSYIDITDAFVDYYGVLVEDVPMPPPQPARRIQHDNVFTLNSAGQNRIHFCVEGQVGRRLVQAWINAIRLASWEKMRLEEIYTGALLRTRLSAIAAHQAAAQGLPPPGPDGVIVGPDGTPLPPLKLITPLTKGKMEGWIKARFMGSTEWQKCYLVLQERRAPHEDESMMANAVAGASSSSSSSGPGAASIDASFGGPNSSSSGGDKKKFWQKLPGSGSNRDSILSLGGGKGGDGGGSSGPLSPTAGASATFANDPSAAGPSGVEPPPGHNGAMGVASFYETKKSKRAFATLMYVSGVFAVYPSRPELVEGSSLFKVEGAFPGSNVLSATAHARQTGFVLIMPEVDSGSSGPASPPLGSFSSSGTSGALGANTKMMNWVIGFMDVFRLYGRPRSLSWDPRDPASFFFAYPIGPFRDRLFLDRELAEFLDVREERHAAQRANLGMVIRKRMQGERTPVLPPLPVPNRESTALLERRASRLVSGGITGTTAGGPGSGSGSAGNNGVTAQPPQLPALTRPDTSDEEEDTDKDEDDDDDDDNKPLSNGMSRLAVTNGTPGLAPSAVASPPSRPHGAAAGGPPPAPSSTFAPAATSRGADAYGSSSGSSAGGALTTAALQQQKGTGGLTPADTAQNIAQLRRLSEVDPGLGPEFAALLNFDGGVAASDTESTTSETRSAAPATAKKAILGPGAGNAAASAYGGGASRGVQQQQQQPQQPTSPPSDSGVSTPVAGSASSWSTPPSLPPKTHILSPSGGGTPPGNQQGSWQSPNSVGGTAATSVVRPTAVLAAAAPASGGAETPLAAVPEYDTLDAGGSATGAQQAQTNGGGSGGGGGQRVTSAAYDEGSLLYLSSMSDQQPAPAPVPAPAPAQPTNAQAPSVPKLLIPESAPAPAPAAARNSATEDGGIGDDALAAYSFLEKPPSPAIGYGASAQGTSDISRASSASVSTSADANAARSAAAAAAATGPTTTFSQANKRAMERKTAAQLQAQAHQEAMMKPAGKKTQGKKVVDMAKARKRGTGAWGGDTSSDEDDEDEDEEEEEGEEDGRGRSAGAGAGAAARLASSTGSVPLVQTPQQPQQQPQQQQYVQPSRMPNSRSGSNSHMHSLEELQRAAAQAGLQAPAPGRFSSYDGLSGGMGGGSGGSVGGSSVRAPSPGGAGAMMMGPGMGPGASGSPSASGWGSGRSSPMRTASPAGAGAYAPGAGTGSGKNSPRNGPVHVVGPGGPAMMLQSAMGISAGSVGRNGGAGMQQGGPGGSNVRGSVFNSHLGAQHELGGEYGGDASQGTSGSSGLAPVQATAASSSSNTFVQLQPEEQPGAMTTIFQPHGLLQAGAQDKLERSAKAREEEARAAGGHLVSVPNKPPPPQAGLLGAITAHERDRKGAGGIGATLTERERERVAAERRMREEEAANAAMYRQSFAAGGGMGPMGPMMGMGMNPAAMMGMYGNPYMWQQMMMQQQQQQGPGTPGGAGWSGSQYGGGGGGAGSPTGGAGGTNSPGRVGTPSGGHAQHLSSSASMGGAGAGAGGGFDAMMAQQAAMQAAQQAYMQAMSQMGGGGPGSAIGGDAGNGHSGSINNNNRMSMAMGMPPVSAPMGMGPMGPMGMGMGMGMGGMGYGMPGPMSMMGFPAFPGGPGSMMGHGGGGMMGGAPSEFGAGPSAGLGGGGGGGAGGGAMPSPASVAAAARLRAKADSPGPARSMRG